MAAEPNQLSVQEYLRLERLAETKSEYLDGEMVAMTGVTLRHSGIIINVARELSGQPFQPIRPTPTPAPSRRWSSPRARA